MRTLKAAALAIAAAFLLAPSAWADEPPNAVAAQWGPTQHVVVAPGANPTLTNPTALNNQIGATGLPIYVAVTNSTPADLGKAFSQKLGHQFQGVIVAAGSHGVYAAAVNTPGGSQAADIASQVAKQYGRNLDAGLHAYVVNFAQAAQSASHPGASAGGAPHKTTNLTWLWWTLGGLGLLAGLIAGYVFASRRSRAQAAQRKKVNGDMIRAKAKVDDLADWVNTESVDVSAEHRKATIALGDAQTAYDEHRYSDAATHLENVAALYSRADRKVNPPAPHSASEGIRQARAVPQEDRRQATINATTPGGQTVVINNNDYRTTPSAGYTNRWPGGMYNNVYFAPGCYPYAFWGPGYNWSLTDMVIADAIIEDRWAGRYDYNNNMQASSGGGDYPADTNWQGDTSSQGGGDYGTGQDNSTSSGGGDYSAPDPAPSYSDPAPSYSAPDPTPSYDPAPSYDSGGGGGGGDYGGSSGGDGW